MTAVGTHEAMPSPSALAGHKRSGLVNTAVFVGLIVAYKLVLEVAYLQVADAFAYQGLFFVLDTGWTRLLGWLILFVLMPIFKKVFDDPTPSGNILSLLILFSVIPCIVLISYRADYPKPYIEEIVAFWVLTFTCWWLTKPLHFGLSSSLITNKLYVATAIILSGAVIFYSYINTGLRLYFNIIDVYDIRAEARDFDAPFGISYIVSLADNILPVLAVVFIAQKRWILASAIFFVIFINFSITGTKQILFVPALGILGYYGVKQFSFTYRIIFGATLLCAASILENVLFGSMTLHTIFAYRVLFIPAELHYAYYTFFQSHEFLYYSQSLLKAYASTEQDNIQFVIGEYAIGDYSARANNGLFSDAYMNLGLFGVLIYPLIIAGYLRILDGSIFGLPQRMIFVVTVYVAFVLLGMTLTSAFITSGLLFLVVLLYSIPRSSVMRGLPAR